MIWFVAEIQFTGCERRVECRAPKSICIRNNYAFEPWTDLRENKTNNKNKMQSAFLLDNEKIWIVKDLTWFSLDVAYGHANLSGVVYIPNFISCVRASDENV